MSGGAHTDAAACRRAYRFFIIRWEGAQLKRRWKREGRAADAAEGKGRDESGSVVRVRGGRIWVRAGGWPRLSGTLLSSQSCEARAKLTGMLRGKASVRSLAGQHRVARLLQLVHQGHVARLHNRARLHDVHLQQRKERRGQHRRTSQTGK